MRLLNDESLTPPVKRDFTAQNRAHQTSNGFDSSLSQSGTSVNTVTSSSILKKTLGSMGMRQQKPKRRVPGAPSVINIHTKQVTENFSPGFDTKQKHYQSGPCHSAKSK